MAARYACASLGSEAGGRGGRERRAQGREFRQRAEVQGCSRRPPAAGKASSPLQGPRARHTDCPLPVPVPTQCGTRSGSGCRSVMSLRLQPPPSAVRRKLHPRTAGTPAARHRSTDTSGRGEGPPRPARGPWNRGCWPPPVPVAPLADASAQVPGGPGCPVASPRTPGFVLVFRQRGARDHAEPPVSASPSPFLARGRGTLGGPGARVAMSPRWLGWRPVVCSFPGHRPVGVQPKRTHQNW